MKNLTQALFYTLALFHLVGCSHYQVGRTGWNGEEQSRISVWIAPVVMKAAISDVAVPLNRELREQVIRNRRLRLVEASSQADVQLLVSVESRERESLARRSDDTGLSDVLRFDLKASYELKSTESEILKSGEVMVEGQVFRGSGFNESARQRLPSMLRDLSDDILQEAFLDW